jgi:hypothetical protein
VELVGLNTKEITLYNDNPACDELIATELYKLKVSFPDLSNDFISVLSERLRVNNFTDKRLVDAIGNVIDNFQYKKPNISDIIGFDKKLKLYTYNEVYEFILEGESWENYPIYEVNGTKFRIKISDKIKYNL